MDRSDSFDNKPVKSHIPYGKGAIENEINGVEKNEHGHKNRHEKKTEDAFNALFFKKGGRNEQESSDDKVGENVTQTKRKSLENIKIKAPNKNTLILASICFALLIISFAYKAKLSADTGLPTDPGISIVAGSLTGATDQSPMDQKVADALQQAQLDDENSTTTDELTIKDTDSMSDKFTKNLLLSYAQHQNDGTDVSDDEINQIASQSLDSTQAPQAKYSLNDLQISADTSEGGYRAFGNSFGGIYFNFINNIVSNQDKYDSSLPNVAQAYDEVGQKLLKIPVPTTLANDYLTYINDFSMLSDSMLIVSKQQDDPVKALVGLRQLQSLSQQQEDLFLKIAKFFSDNGIIFKDSEPGIVLNIAAQNAAENPTATTDSTTDDQSSDDSSQSAYINSQVQQLMPTASTYDSSSI